MLNSVGNGGEGWGGVRGIGGLIFKLFKPLGILGPHAAVLGSPAMQCLPR